MTDLLDDSEAGLDDSEALEYDPAGPISAAAAGAFFGDYSVLSPGVQIVLEGRPVSAPASD